MRTPNSDERDMCVKLLKSSLNTAVTGLAMIRLSLAPDHTDNTFINSIMGNLDK